MNHTEGTWVAKARAVGGYNIVAVDDVLEDVVVGTAVQGEFSLEMAHANAQMLAAGPKLVTCVKMLLECAEIAAELMVIVGDQENVSLAQIDAAIAQAKSCLGDVEP